MINTIASQFYIDFSTRTAMWHCRYVNRGKKLHLTVVTAFFLMIFLILLVYLVSYTELMHILRNIELYFHIRVQFPLLYEIVVNGKEILTTMVSKTLYVDFFLFAALCYPDIKTNQFHLSSIFVHNLNTLGKKLRYYYLNIYQSTPI